MIQVPGHRLTALATMLIAALMLMMLPTSQISAAETPRGDVPWWKQQKICFMWGDWGTANPDKSKGPPWVRPVPRKVLRNVALSGGTVFADTWNYFPDHARFAKKLGLKYFAPVHLHHMTWKPGGRTWINHEGKEAEKYPDTTGQLHRCPLDAFVYERWLVDDKKMAGIREGIIDGIHVDWESAEAGICYCDDCFAKFLDIKGIKADQPEKSKRFLWLQTRGFTGAYEANFHERRVEMFTRIREKVQAINPYLLFSSYGTTLTDFTQAMNTPETPFICLDARHYYNDDRRPWWESYSARLRKEGYLYIPGSWTNALFGSMPSQVSAARWIYEASINEDGCWLWFEHEPTDEIFSAYASADRRIKAVQSIVGKYLFHGQRDLHFVTAVEWTGNPELERAAIHVTYHLDDEHLVHINNVNTEWPLRVRARLPHLAGEQQWTVRDPLGDVYYTPDGESPVWTSVQLHAGVVIAMDTRSDVFLLVSPMNARLNVDASQLMRSREIDTMSSHEVASQQVTGAQGQRDLPKFGWHFRMDSNDTGVAEQWYLPDASLDSWSSIEIESFWGDIGGIGGVGPGWYRRDVHFPRLPEDKRIYLHFGAVDEELKLWIDGQYVGEYNRGPDGWNRPFAIDVTGKLKAGQHHLALRVYNSAFAGGVWKPVSLLAGPAEETEICLFDEKLNALLASAEKLVIPAPPSASDRMVYTATEEMLSDGNSGVRSMVNNAIYTVAANGQDALRVRHLRGYLWSPQYAPNGKTIAFVHDAGGRGQVYMMNADGSDTVNLSSNTFCDRSPVWSPDGRKIAFLSDREGDWNIYCMNADGSDQHRLAGNNGLDRAPAWSPDGSKVAWESHVSGIPSIWVCHADGHSSRPLILPDQPLAVQRPKQGKDAVFKFTDAWNGFSNNTFYLTNPVWSPDGTRLAARGLGSASGDMLAVLDADGTRMMAAIGWIAGLGNIEWSPDGTQLAGTLRTAPQEAERSGVFVINADGMSDYRWLVDVSPEGPRLGASTRMGHQTWYSHGSAQPRRVVKTFTSLAWSPDGRRLAFSSDMDRSGAFYVYTMDAGGGDPTRLHATRSAWPNQIMWRPHLD